MKNLLFELLSFNYENPCNNFISIKFAIVNEGLIWSPFTHKYAQKPSE